MDNSVIDDDTLEPLASRRGSIILSPYRFVILVLYSLGAMQNLMMWNMLYPLQTTLKNSYNLPLEIINFGTSIIQNVTYLPGTILTNYLFDEIGIRCGVIIGSIITLVGLWIRIFADKSFYYILASHTLGGIAQPLFFNIPQKISAVWFGPQERNYATTVMVSCFTLAGLISVFVPQYFVDANVEPGPKAIAQINYMFIFMAIVGTVFLFPSLIFMRDKPPHPPGNAASFTKFGHLRGLKMIMKNKNCIIFLIAHGIIHGVLITQSYVNQPQYDPFLIDFVTVGDLLALNALVSIPGGLLGAYYVTKTRKYKSSLSWLNIITTLSILGTLLVAYTKSNVVIAIFYIAVGFLTAPLLPISLEFLVEISFPVGEATSGGAMIMLSEIFSGIFSFILALILDEGTQHSSVVSFIIMTFLCAAASLIFIFTKEDLRRSKYEVDIFLPQEETKD